MDPTGGRVHERLFKSDDPTASEGGCMEDINPNSEIVYNEALLEEGFKEVQRKAPWPLVAGEGQHDAGAHTVRFQAIRVAYFVCSQFPAAGNISGIYKIP